MSEYTSVFPVGHRTCRLSATVRTTAPTTALNGMSITWSPDSPGAMSPGEQAQYVNGVSNFLVSMTDTLIPLSIAVPS